MTAELIIFHQTHPTRPRYIPKSLVTHIKEKAEHTALNTEIVLKAKNDILKLLANQDADKAWEIFDVTAEQALIRCCTCPNNNKVRKLHLGRGLTQTPTQTSPQTSQS